MCAVSAQLATEHSIYFTKSSVHGNTQTNIPTNKGHATSLQAAGRLLRTDTAEKSKSALKLVFKVENWLSE